MIALHPDDRLFVLTGAGISAESGIPTFRDANGIWAQYKPDEVATPAAWRANPRHVWKFYSERRQQARGIEPNAGHRALAELEGRLGARMLLCTQNVDALHERAGACRVIHMHGELMKSRCERCARPPFSDEQGYFDEVPRCGCGGRIRPHVVWFGELPLELDEVFAELDRCTVFITVGSSGTVEPAASFPLWAGQKSGRGAARRYYVGAEPPANRAYFDEVFIGKAGELLPRLFAVDER